MPKLLILVVGMLLSSAAVPARAFVLTDVAPARFSESSAGVVVTLGTAQDVITFGLTVLHPPRAREEPKIPLPNVQLEYQWRCPEDSSTSLPRTGGTDGFLKIPERGRSNWEGKSLYIRVSNAAGETQFFAAINISDLKKYQSLGVESLLVVIISQTDLDTKFGIQEVLINDMLDAAMVSIPPQAPQQIRPSAKDPKT